MHLHFLFIEELENHCVAELQAMVQGKCPPATGNHVVHLIPHKSNRVIVAVGVDECEERVRLQFNIPPKTSRDGLKRMKKVNATLNH